MTALHEALLAFQSEAPRLVKSSEAKAGSFSYKYVDLDSVMEKVGPLLTQHGLVWSTFPTRDQHGEPALRYRLTHAESGEFDEDVMPLMISKNDAQGQGSAITYARRYSITAVLNLVADEDDDGGRASTPRQDGDRLASDGQRRLVFAKFKEAEVPPSSLVNIMREAAGAEPLLFDTEAEAQAWVDRALPKLPARLVTPVVEELAKVAVP
jgi:hypothetical protein